MYVSASDLVAIHFLSTKRSLINSRSLLVSEELGVKYSDLVQPASHLSCAYLLPPIFRLSTSSLVKEDKAIDFTL